MPSNYCLSLLYSLHTTLPFSSHTHTHTLSLLLFLIQRLLVTGFFQPILTRIGYSMNWKHTIVISWGGLRGAVGLALALVVAQTSAIDFDNIGSKVR